MSTKIIIGGVTAAGSDLGIVCSIEVDGVFQGTNTTSITTPDYSSEGAFWADARSKIVTWANGDGGYSGVTTGDVYSPLPAPRSFNYAPGRSIVTGTGATGFQVSSIKDSFVTYTAKITTTATIAGGQEGYVVLEVAATNSTTAGDWKEVGRVTNGQALSLALTLQSIQPVSGSVSAFVPAGYYVKVRSVNTTGTPTYIMVSGQEVLL